jgi:hypothetical protein
MDYKFRDSGKFLNTLIPANLPVHKLFPKIGIQMMLLGNLNPPNLPMALSSKRKPSAGILSYTDESVFIAFKPLIPLEYFLEFKRL